MRLYWKSLVNVARKESERWRNIQATEVLQKSFAKSRIVSNSRKFPDRHKFRIISFAVIHNHWSVSPRLASNQKKAGVEHVSRNALLEKGQQPVHAPAKQSCMWARRQQESFFSLFFYIFFLGRFFNRVHPPKRKFNIFLQEIKLRKLR